MQIPMGKRVPQPWDVTQPTHTEERFSLYFLTCIYIVTKITRDVTGFKLYRLPSPPLHWANWRTWQSADSFWATNELSAPLTTLVFFILSLLNEPRRATHLYILAVYINTKLYIPLEKFRLWSVSRKPSWLLLLEQFHKPSDHNEHPSTQFRGMVLALTIVVLLLCFWNQSRQYATSKPEITIFTLSVRQWGK